MYCCSFLFMFIFLYSGIINLSQIIFIGNKPILMHFFNSINRKQLLNQGNLEIQVYFFQEPKDKMCFVFHKAKNKRYKKRIIHIFNLTTAFVLFQSLNIFG